MVVKTYYPPEIYRFLLDIAFKHGLSIKEVETVFIRRQTRELGFECFHQNVGFAKSDGNPYCKGCWTRLEQTRPPTIAVEGMKKRIISPAKYRPLKTFLDELEEERTRRAAFVNPVNPNPATLPNENE